MKTTTSWGLVLAGLMLAACTQGPVLARPDTRAVKAKSQQGLGGTGLAASAQFDAPVVDVNGGPVAPGTGSFTVAPNVTGGPGALGVVDATQGPQLQYVVIGDLSGTPAVFFAILSEGPFTVGTRTVDNVSLYAGLFDAATGEPTHLATSGAVTLTSAGGIGGRWVGSFNGTLEAVASPTQCQSASDCAANEVCSNGVCVRAPSMCSSDADCVNGLVCVGGSCVSAPQCTVDADCGAGEACVGGACVAVAGCTSNAQCGAGQVCTRGQCVAAWQCTVDADCGAGESCVGGACVAVAGCSSNAQCGAGEVCQAGQCVWVPQCTSDADCGAGQQCLRGQCVTGSSGSCVNQQGTGSVVSQVTAVASCSALPAANVTISSSAAYLDDQLRLVLFDPSGAGTEGVLLSLTVCPGAVGTYSLGYGLEEATWLSMVETNDLRLYAERKAASATLTLTRVSPSLGGSFNLSLATGGAVNGSFSMY